MSDMSQRLDAFTDSAFAFAVTLMVVGAGGSALDIATLEATVASLPSFAIGFALIGMFWFGHVRWRQYRGPGDWRSVLLTFLLIFVVLVYITPLRAMAASFADYMMGRNRFRGSLGALFTIYGAGFTAMSAITMLLFHDALRNVGLDHTHRREAQGQIGIWAIIASTGALSTLFATIPAITGLAPWLYASLPLTIGIFSARWRWSEAPGTTQN